MNTQKTYRILEAWEDHPGTFYTLEEALEKFARYAVGVELRVDGGLLHLVGTAFYLQEIMPCKPRTEEHPNAKTCQDCVSFGRCSWLLSRMKEERVCDWNPSRFKQRGQDGQNRAEIA